MTRLLIWLHLFLGFQLGGSVSSSSSDDNQPASSSSSFSFASFSAPFLQMGAVLEGASAREILQAVCRDGAAYRNFLTGTIGDKGVVVGGWVREAGGGGRGRGRGGIDVYHHFKNYEWYWELG